ncbi:MAG: hypothetical protein AB1414_03000 [bacterium]
MKLAWHESIETISETTWNTIFGIDTIVKSYHLMRLVERSKNDDFTIRYLTIHGDVGIKLILPCFLYRVRLDLFAKKTLKSIFEIVGRCFPRLITKKILFLGTPLSICDHLFGIKHPMNEEYQQTLILRAIKEIKDKAKLERCDMVIIKEVRARELEKFKKFMIHEDFFWVESLPDSILPLIEQCKPFPTALRKKYRQEINRVLNTNTTHQFRWTITSTFSKYADQMHTLYENVFYKSKFKFEHLNVNFFKLIENELNNDVSTLLCFNKSDEVVIFVLLLDQQDSLIPLYMGIDYMERNNGNLYFNCIYKIVSEAEQRGKKWVLFGQTSYEPKSHIGAVFERLYLGIWMRNPLLNLISRLFNKLLFPRKELPSCRCYSDNLVQLIKQQLDAEGIHYEPIKTSRKP